MTKKKIIFLALMTLLVLWSSVCLAATWKQEFNEICAQVSTADSLSDEELHNLVSAVDELIPKVEASGDPQSKLYVFRLKKCKDLFNFILDTRK